MGDEDFNLEVIGPESLGNTWGKKNESFSHEQLTMMAYRQCVTSLSKEMKAGHNITTLDSNRKPVMVYVEDTRATAIESVKTLKNVMISDLQGTNFLKEMENLLKVVEDKRLYWLKEQWRWWVSLPSKTLQDYMKNNIYVREEYFASKLPYWDFYQDDTLEIYRKIFEQLELCLGKIKYYKKGKVTNIAEVNQND